MSGCSILRRNMARARLNVRDPQGAQQELDYIHENELPIWEFQRTLLNELQARINFIPRISTYVPASPLPLKLTSEREFGPVYGPPYNLSVPADRQLDQTDPAPEENR